MPDWRIKMNNLIKIWEPRYRDDVVLIAVNKVKDNNIIVFTRAKYLKGKTFYILAEDIKQCPIDTNGKIACYAVPMSLLKEM